MTIARGAAVLALALAILLAAWLLLFRGAGGTEYTLLFETAGQLVPDNDVQVGGRRVGSIKSIELTDDNQAASRSACEEPYAPLREGTEATIRLTSLSGIATATRAPPAPTTPRAPRRRDADDRLDDAGVDLDQIFNTLDEKTRGDLQDVVKGFATQYRARARRRRGGRVLQPAAVDVAPARRRAHRGRGRPDALHRRLLAARHRAGREARRPRVARRQHERGRAGDRLGERRARRSALGLLPTTLRRANTTFVNLRATLDDLDVLVAESKPATKDLAPFLRELRPLVAESRPRSAT